MCMLIIIFSYSLCLLEFPVNACKANTKADMFKNRSLTKYSTGIDNYYYLFYYMYMENGKDGTLWK
jgi:hypothetical protein